MRRVQPATHLPVLLLALIVMLLLGRVGRNIHCSSQPATGVGRPSSCSGANDEEQAAPSLIADAGSIEQYGIELAAVLAAGIAEVIGSSCYDSLQVEGCSAPFRTGLRRL
jgi:hypothetical protein